MRGKLIWNNSTRSNERITPAHAGKTFILRVYPRKIQDHPRACGENSKRVFCRWAKRGSPPRMRGKPHSLCNFSESFRITPAHAGKTLSATAWRRLTLGSPPRMRGKPASWEFVMPLIGITPAHAGKTIKLGAWKHESRDHPRACGENGRRFS